MTTIETQLEVAMRALRWLAQCDDAEARLDHEFIILQVRKAIEELNDG